MTDLRYLRLEDNNIIGTIPSSIGNMTEMVHINLNRNIFSSTIPSLLSQLPKLVYLYLAGNYFTGTLPESLSQLHETLLDFDVGDNDLTGSIPSSLGLLSKLSTFSLRFNHFVGPVPTTLSALHGLRILQLNGNYLSGSLDALFSSDVNLTHLQVFDASDNALTGNLPPFLFVKLPQLSTVSLSLNCISGSLSSQICAADSMQVLSFDGMGSSKNCEGYGDLFNFFKPQGLTGSIPECMLAMPSLVLLHLSANALTGTIPSNFLSPSLQNISLSHNHLSSTIPYSFQQGQLRKLDLSQNKLTGVWQKSRGDIVIERNSSANSSSATYATDMEVKLTVNRLSGDLPDPIKLTNIDILKGNLFGCGFPLPEHDPFRNEYSCGSSQLDKSLYFLLGGVCCMVVVVLMYVMHRYQRSRAKQPRGISETATFGNEEKGSATTSQFHTNSSGSSDKMVPFEVCTEVRPNYATVTTTRTTITADILSFKVVSLFSTLSSSVYLYIFFLLYLDERNLPNIRSFQLELKKVARTVVTVMLLGFLLYVPIFALKLSEEGKQSFEFTTHKHSYG